MDPTTLAPLSLTCADQEYDLSALPLPVVVCEQDGAVRTMTSAAVALLGGRAPAGRDGLACLLAAAGVEEPVAILRRARTRARTVRLRRQGRRLRVSVSATSAPDGSTAFLLIPDPDDTAREAQRAEFQSLVAHDLRSPLAVIQGYAGLLATGLSGPLNGDQREFVAGIELKIEELVRLLDDFLDYQRLEAGALALRRESVGLADLAAQLVEEYAGRAARRGQVLSLDLDGSDLSLDADPLRVRQILDNLLCNAVKYADEGTWIRIGGRRVGQDVELTVADGGPGVPAAELAVLFRPYGRGSLAGRASGTGLGLLVVQRLVECHGGRIAVESPAGAGLRFVVTLPQIGPGPAADV
ncbi:MAG: HAMP domain-containing sensor histidine kinase [Candidatus Krumholzibacteriia bacterium]